MCGVMGVREPTGVDLLMLGRWMGVRSVSVVVGVAVPGSGPAREAPPQQAHAETAMRTPDAAPSHGYRRSGTTWREA